MWTIYQWCRVQTSFSSFFAYVIKDPLTKHDIATNDMDENMNRQEQQNEPNRGWYAPKQEGVEVY